MRRTTSGSKASPFPKGWCLLCGVEHLYIYPCQQLKDMPWYEHSDEDLELLTGKKK